MFEVGWSEMLVIAIVMIVVVGPKDLPAMLRTFGRTVAKLRGMAGDFQKQFNDALKEAELDDVKKSVDSLRSLNPMNEIRKQLNPFEKAAADVRSGLDDVMKPKPAAVDAKAATPEASPAEPAAGSTPATPVAGGPEAMPASATFPAMTDASVVADAKPAAPKKPAKLAATKAAKAAPEKATTAKAAAAPKIAEKPAAKAVPAKATTEKTAPAPKAAEKPALKAVKAAAVKPEAKPAVTAAKKPAAARKKTAGTAK